MKKQGEYADIKGNTEMSGTDCAVIILLITLCSFCYPRHRHKQSMEANLKIRLACTLQVSVITLDSKDEDYLTQSCMFSE